MTMSSLLPAACVRNQPRVSLKNWIRFRGKGQRIDSAHFEPDIALSAATYALRCFGKHLKARSKSVNERFDVGLGHRRRKGRRSGVDEDHPTIEEVCEQDLQPLCFIGRGIRLAVVHRHTGFEVNAKHGTMTGDA